MKIFLIVFVILLLAVVLFSIWLLCYIAKDDEPNRSSRNFPFSIIVMMLLYGSAVGQSAPLTIQTLKPDSNCCFLPFTPNKTYPVTINADTIPWKSKSKPYTQPKNWGWDTSFIISGRLFITDSIIPKYDTIPVLMLVADTGHLMWETYEFSYDTTQKADTSSYLIGTGVKSVMKDHGYRTHAIWWIMGYEVREAYGYWGGSRGTPTQGNITFDGAAYWTAAFTHVAYLSEDKKPLPASIVVWMTK